MGEPKTSAEEIQVFLGRPGVGVQEYRLPEGATLADLLRKSGANTKNQDVFVGNVLVDEALRLQHRAIVWIVPHPKNAASDEPWRATIPAFQDDDLFQEYAEALKARRRTVDPEEGPTA
jgi:hypothetical protein